jgi:hypothetical protein
MSSPTKSPCRKLNSSRAPHGYASSSWWNPWRGAHSWFGFGLGFGAGFGFGLALGLGSGLGLTLPLTL